MDRALPRKGIQVISRAALILRVLRDDPLGLSLGQIAERVSLPRSTVQRIVSVLAEEGLVVTRGDRGIRLGPEITSLARAAAFNVVQACRPVLAQLAGETGETADLSVMRRSHMVFLDQVPGSHRLRTVSAVGDVFPLTVTANGKSALALLPASEAMELAARERGAASESAPWAAAFSEELARVRITGLAYDLDEQTAGISAVGVAFRDPTRTIHAISIPVPTSRFAAARLTVEHALLRARDQLHEIFHVQ